MSPPKMPNRSGIMIYPKKKQNTGHRNWRRRALVFSGANPQPRHGAIYLQHTFCAMKIGPSPNHLQKFSLPGRRIRATTCWTQSKSAMVRGILWCWAMPIGLSRCWDGQLERRLIEVSISSYVPSYHLMRKRCSADCQIAIDFQTCFTLPKSRITGEKFS